VYVCVCVCIAMVNSLHQDNRSFTVGVAGFFPEKEMSKVTSSISLGEVVSLVQFLVSGLCYFLGTGRSCV